MTAERLRAYLLTLPHVVETMQWGANLVFWAGDKAMGGKMFALINLDPDGRHALISYAAGPERYADLVEQEGLLPAPYFARIHWIAAERWDVFRDPEWHTQLGAAHALTLARLPPKVTKLLALPAKEQSRIIAEARRRLEEKAKQTKSTMKFSRSRETTIELRQLKTKSASQVLSMPRPSR